MLRFLISHRRYIMIAAAFTILTFVIILGLGGYMLLQHALTLTRIDYCVCTTCNRAAWDIPIYQQLDYSSAELCRVEVEKMTIALRERPVEIWLWWLLPPSFRPSCETLNVCLIWTEQERYNEMAIGMFFSAILLGNGLALKALQKPFKLI